MTTVACVLKSGGHYTPEWVRKLRNGVQRHSGGLRFVCLTDVPHELPDVETIPLKYDWPGWWSKMELFRPDVFPDSRVLYLDLDTLVMGDLTDLAHYDGMLGVLRDFYRPDRWQTGVMSWRRSLLSDHLWFKWLESPQDHMIDYGSQNKGQGWWLCDTLRRFLMGEPDMLQDECPGQIESLKPVDSFTVRTDIPKCALLCGHGKPRFDDPAAGWAHEMWRGE